MKFKVLSGYFPPKYFTALLLLLSIGLFSIVNADDTLTFTNNDLDAVSTTSENEALTIGQDDLLGNSTTSQPAEVSESEVKSNESTPVIEVIDGGIKAPYLWKIHGDTPSFLFGTIHIPDSRVTTLKGSVKKAFDESDAVYTEIPMGLMDMLRVSGMTALPPGESLDEILDEKTRNRVEKILQKYNMNMAFFNTMKVWALAAQLGQLDILEELAKNPVVLDLKIYTDANAAGKEVGGLETAESQVAVFDELTQKEQIRFLMDTLEAIEKVMAEGKKPSDETVNAYLSGDSAELVKALTEYLDLDDAFSMKLYNRLLPYRDQKMSERIDTMIKNNPEKSYFFAVGAAHLPRKDGIVGVLRDMGYTVTRVVD